MNSMHDGRKRKRLRDEVPFIPTLRTKIPAPVESRDDHPLTLPDPLIATPHVGPESHIAPSPHQAKRCRRSFEVRSISNAENEVLDTRDGDDAAPWPSTPARRVRRKPVKQSLENHEWPLAIVVWYNLRNIIVRCPYCGELEGFNKLHAQNSVSLDEFRAKVGHTRLALCEYTHNLPYILAFPGDNYKETVNLGWFIAKNNKTLGRSHIRTIENSTEDYDEKSPTLWQDKEDIARELCQQTDPVYLIDPSLNDPRDDAGNTALVNATQCGDLARVKLELSRGADVNGTNNEGSSPLMYAALLGYVDIAMLLLKSGARRQARNGLGKRAVDLSQDTNSTRQNRKRLAAAIQRFGRIQFDVSSQNRQRVLIRILLGGAVNPSPIAAKNLITGQSSSTPTSERFGTWRPSKHGGNIHFLISMTSFSTTNAKAQTLAVMERGAMYPVVYAKSGFSKNGKEFPGFLDGHRASNDVIEICKFFAHDLPGHFRDWKKHGYVDGQYYASHAETQLMIAFVLKHRFVRTGKVEDELSRIQPPNKIKEVTISVDSVMCSYCKMVQALIEKEFDVKFNIIQMRRTLELDAETNVVADVSKVDKTVSVSKEAQVATLKKAQLLREQDTLQMNLYARNKFVHDEQVPRLPFNTEPPSTEKPISERYPVEAVNTGLLTPPETHITSPTAITATSLNTSPRTPQKKMLQMSQTPRTRPNTRAYTRSQVSSCDAEVFHQLEWSPAKRRTRWVQENSGCGGVTTSLTAVQRGIFAVGRKHYMMPPTSSTASRTASSPLRDRGRITAASRALHSIVGAAVSLERLGPGQLSTSIPACNERAIVISDSEDEDEDEDEA